MTSKLDRIEARLKAFFEKSAQISPQNQLQLQLAEQLVAAMRSAIEQNPDGTLTAPGSYLITMPPQMLALWQNHPELKNALQHVLREAAQEASISFTPSLTIRLASDDSISAHAVRVTLDHASAGVGKTAAMPLSQTSQENPETAIPPHAFLILEGKHGIPLTEAIINLGRRLDNHIALDDPRVSRHHAQLRAMQGRYVLFDLNATGGTYVNGQRIHQATLQPGDVISLAGVPLIYGEDTSPPDHISQTGVILPPAQPSPGKGLET